MQWLKRYQLPSASSNLVPNLWDVIIGLLIFSVFAAIAWGGSQMAVPYQVGEPLKITLDPHKLPSYALSTILRMFIALFFSLLFTFTVAPLAAKNKHAERFLIPFIDIMQSIPILGFLSISTIGFIALFPNSLLGPEFAAIFAIFTSQVWNMTLSLYQSLKTVPKELKEAARMYQLSGWQQFWRIELPHGTPGLLWNTMMSMSAGWFFVVLSEAISVANQKITLPGIGSYISKAISESNLTAMGYAILAMFVVILLYDQLLFRPLLAWSEKFKSEIDEEKSVQESWFFELMAQTKLLKKLRISLLNLSDWFINPPKLNYTTTPLLKRNNYWLQVFSVFLWYVILILSVVAASISLALFIKNALTIKEVLHVLYLGSITGIKVVILIIIASLIWVPVGVWIGLNPKLSHFVQPLIQFLAAFPANFFYPIAVLLILHFQLNGNIWTTPLMILGTQWYILFNVIAGTASIPKEIKLAAKNFGVTGWLWWKKLMLPAIFPFFVTGAMTAAGGCWNASIVAEYVTWGENSIISLGLGSYIEEFTRAGDFPRLTLGIAVMCLYVILFNRLLWQKLYHLAETRFAME